MLDEPGTNASLAGDYPQNWYDQGIAVDPNNPDRIFVDTFEVWLANRTGTTWYDTTCGYSGPNPKPVHVDQHALAFVPGSSSMLLAGNDGGVHGTLNADAAALNTLRFFQDESCGQCTPCRAGTAKAVAIMEQPEWDVELLGDLSQVMRDASICGLGQAAPNPVDCVVRYFPHELTGN